MLAAFEGGKEGGVLRDDDVGDAVQPGTGLEEVVLVLAEDDLLLAAELLQLEGAAAKSHLAEAVGVGIDDLLGDDGPGSVRHLPNSGHKGPLHHELEGVGIRRLVALDAVREALVRGREGGAAALEAGDAVLGGHFFAGARPSGMDFDAGAEGEDELQVLLVRLLELLGQVIEDDLFGAGAPGVEVGIDEGVDIEAGEVDVGVNAERGDATAEGNAAAEARGAGGGGAGRAACIAVAAVAAVGAAIATDEGGAGGAEGEGGAAAEESPPANPFVEALPVAGLHHVSTSDGRRRSRERYIPERYVTYIHCGWPLSTTASAG